MRQDRRNPFATALHASRVAAYPPGDYIGQESFMTAGEIRALARRAGVGPGVRVLDVCCGVAGPGRLITAECGCDYLGVDYSASALELARELAGPLACRFDRVHVPPLPGGPFDVVLLLETMLAFADKHDLLAAVSRALAPGGRFACTVETGAPLSTAERARMPDADTVWLVEIPELITLLRAAGLCVSWQQDVTDAHRAIAAALLTAFRSRADVIAALVGVRATTELIAAHELWVDWLATARVRKIALIATKPC